jgi:hypothetical protein
MVRGGRPTQEAARSAASFIFKQADHVAYLPQNRHCRSLDECLLSGEGQTSKFEYSNQKCDLDQSEECQ